MTLNFKQAADPNPVSYTHIVNSHFQTGHTECLQHKKKKSYDKPEYHND